MEDVVRFMGVKPRLLTLIESLRKGKDTPFTDGLAQLFGGDRLPFWGGEANRLGLKNITFRGFVSGREKYEQLARLSCLFVPSDFENFGMIVTEALSVGTPAIASLGTPWEELNAIGCGWWTERSPENIAQVMRQVMEMPITELLTMGEKGHGLVQDKYTAPQWLDRCKGCMNGY